MASTPGESPNPVLNYAEVVKRCAAMHQARIKESEDAHDAERQHPPAPVLPEHRGEGGGGGGGAGSNNGEGRRECDLEIPLLPTPTVDSLLSPPFQASVLSSAKAISAKPYVPSYLAAVKTQSSTVMLEGVPVNVNKAQRQANTEWCSSTNFSNSMVEHDTISSWADDDDCFLESIGITTWGSRAAVSSVDGSMTGKGRQQQQQQPQQQNSNAMSGGSGNRPRGKRAGNGDPKRSGWRYVEAGRGSNAPNNAPSADTRGGRQHPRGGRNTNTNNSRGGGGGGSGGGAWEGSKQGNSTEISGGRFDVLADAKIMRHL